LFLLGPISEHREAASSFWLPAPERFRTARESTHVVAGQAVALTPTNTASISGGLVDDLIGLAKTRPTMEGWTLNRRLGLGRARGHWSLFAICLRIALS
jgi:hypothetical protein